MDLNPRTKVGLGNIHQFLWDAYRAKLITAHEKQSLLTLQFRLMRYLDACTYSAYAMSDAQRGNLMLQVDVAMGMQIALSMSCEFIRDRAKNRLLDVNGLVVACQDKLVSYAETSRVANNRISETEEVLRDAKQTRDDLKKLL